MKIYPDDALRQNILREIQQVESYIQEYRNEKGCLYWIFTFDRYSLSDLHNRLKKLRDELSYLEND
jgi:hypothetical protein